MDFFGLIDVLRDYCEDNGIELVYGEDAFANTQTDGLSTEDNGLVLIAAFNAVPTFTLGRITECKYTGVLSLGEKCETDEDTEEETESSLDETPIQKYDRRLKYLTTKLSTVIGDIACENELEVSGLSFRYDLNKFDLNADFAATTITFSH